MSLQLKAVMPEQFPCLEEIFKARIVESRLQERTQVVDLFERLERGYRLGFMGAYVDSFENPKHCLVMCHFPGMVTSGSMAHISLIYSVPEERGKPEFVDALFQAAEAYARLNKCETLVGTSWLYRGSKGTDSLWISRGFEVQETTFIKNLT